MSQGHTVTLFNRGQTNPGLFPNVEKLRGDRDGGLDVLRGREWDAVIDNSGYVPRLVRDSAQLLKDSVGRYLFVSSISVYDVSLTAGQNEYEAPIATMEDPTIEDTRQYYGPLKALCEQEVEAAFGDRAISVRPGVIAGPGDPTDRIRHWVARVDRGGEIMVPGEPTDRVQYIDARDLTGWSVRMLEQGDSGLYNAVGPTAPLSSAELVYGIRAVSSGDVSFTWVDESFLAENEVSEYSYMPWLPSTNAMHAFNYVNHTRALGTGLTFLPLATTAFDMLEEYHANPDRHEPGGFGRRGGVPWARETELLQAWHARTGG
jgi:2'-hydroxyisoflavone reductase